MKKLVLTVAVGAAVLMLKTTAVQAQGTAPDHLLCYTVKDTLKLPTPNTLDLQAVLQPEFSQKGCTVIKPVEFCVPAIKTNVNPAPPNPGITGQPLQNDFVCYIVKCPKSVRPTAKQITDQFGQRLDLMVRPVTVCVPATKAPLGCPVGSTSRAACGGPCPLATQVCVFKPTAKGSPATCECVTPPKGCAKPDKFGACGGDCSSMPGTVCQPSVSTTGAHTCACLPPPPPACGLDPATGTCGGSCATATDKCSLDAAGQCSCQPGTQACASGPNGTCGGTCPLPGEQCHPDSTGVCTCATPCGQNPLTGQCGGACATAGDVCVLTTTGCECQPPTNVLCHVDANNVCGGVCPAGQNCGTDSTGACSCLPAPSPCGLVGTTGQCGGACPSGTTCRVFNTTAGVTCACQ